MFLNRQEIVFAVFFHTHEIHKAVNSVDICISLAFSTPFIKFSTDFSLNHSNSSIFSCFLDILKISTKLFIIPLSKNIHTCFSHNQSILNHCFHTANVNFS
ncbi:hypothetical protein HOG21_05875 [bacterium]|nr:hypothetical protein [bacterium]